MSKQSSKDRMLTSKQSREFVESIYKDKDYSNFRVGVTQDRVSDAKKFNEHSIINTLIGGGVINGKNDPVQETTDVSLTRNQYLRVKDREVLDSVEVTVRQAEKVTDKKGNTTLTGKMIQTTEVKILKLSDTSLLTSSRQFKGAEHSSKPIKRQASKSHRIEKDKDVIEPLTWEKDNEV